MLYREIMAVCSEIHTKYIIHCMGRTGGTYSDHWALKGYISVIKTSQLMLYRKIITVCSEIHTNHINTGV